RRAICACLSLAHLCPCRSFWHLWAAVAWCIRAARRPRLALLGQPELGIGFRPCPDVVWRTLRRHRMDPFGINFILWAAATARFLLSNARKPPVFRAWWSQSARPGLGLGERAVARG